MATPSRRPVVPKALGGNPVALCSGMQQNDARFPPKAAGRRTYYVGNDGESVAETL